ncbi:hypothetical protein HAX54_046816 [Datura stramonium]|uniref:Uncharacterized protein n=1 Tax=Datura stramonium TaxID=4076 RepID=A0ABS8WHJ9_DATST|nr:hypothetical protein [Datura stramonium]
MIRDGRSWTATLVRVQIVKKIKRSSWFGQESLLIAGNGRRQRSTSSSGGLHPIVHFLDYLETKEYGACFENKKNYISRSKELLTQLLFWSKRWHPFHKIGHIVQSSTHQVWFVSTSIWRGIIWKCSIWWHAWSFHVMPTRSVPHSMQMGQHATDATSGHVCLSCFSSWHGCWNEPVKHAHAAWCCCSGTSAADEKERSRNGNAWIPSTTEIQTVLKVFFSDNHARYNSVYKKRSKDVRILIKGSDVLENSKFSLIV